MRPGLRPTRSNTKRSKLNALHGLDAVGHDDDALDDDVVGAQELDGQRPGGVLALAGGAAVGDGDDGALDGLK